MTISTVSAIPPARTSFSVQSTIQPVQPVAAPSPLAPAVKLDIQSSDRLGSASTTEKIEVAEQDTQRIRIDQETKAIVYQVVDPASGDVIVQLPDATVLKARAYADAAATKAERADRPFEKSA